MNSFINEIFEKTKQERFKRLFLKLWELAKQIAVSEGDSNGCAFGFVCVCVCVRERERERERERGRTNLRVREIAQER